MTKVKEYEVKEALETISERGPKERCPKKTFTDHTTHPCGLGLKKVKEALLRETTHLQAALPVSQLSNAFESKMPQIV